MFLEHKPCIECDSSDGLALYYNEEEGGTYSASCFAQCGGKSWQHNELVDTYIGDEYNLQKTDSSNINRVNNNGGRVKQAKPPISEADKLEIESNGKFDDTGYRQLGLPVNEKYGVISHYDPNGVITHRYYPVTCEGTVVGYKGRELPKAFFSKGRNDNNCELFGQSLFPRAGKRLLIVGGEEDVLAAYEMLRLDQARRGKTHVEPIAVVSPTTGESGCVKQIQANYEWIDKFEEIVVMFDNDEAGRDATKKALKVLPVGKTKVVTLSSKDPCDMRKEGKDVEFVRSFYDAKKDCPVGIVGSSGLKDKIMARAKLEKVPLPPFAKKLQKMMAGGIPLGYIINIASACVDKETEYLSEQGWVKISEYKGGKVAQYTSGGVCEFVEPTKYIDVESDGFYHTKGRFFDMMLSGEHQVVYQNKKFGGNDLGEIRKMSMVDLYTKHNSMDCGFRGMIPSTFKYEGVGIDMTDDELRLQVAVQADGRIVKEGANNYTQMRFAKKRKYDRLINICKNGGLRYKDNGLNNQGQYEVIVWPKFADKIFDSKYYAMTQHQLNVFCSEVLLWDGDCKNRYSSEFKENVDFVQFAFSAIGKTALIGADNRQHKYLSGKHYTVSISNRTHFGISGKKEDGGKHVEIVKKEPVEGERKYCFTVPSSMLILRRNGRVFITGNSGQGKSTLVNEFIYYWIFNSPYKVGVVSLESDPGEYGELLLSRHVGQKIALLETVADKVGFLNSSIAQEGMDELFHTAEGEDRFHVVDHQGSVGEDELKAKCEYLVRGLGCRLIIVDPLTLALSGGANEDIDEFMSWQKKFVDQHQCVFVNVTHVRKNSNNQQANSRGGAISEESIKGSGSIFQVAGANILLMRDKENEDPIVRNTTKIVQSKCRWTGITGPAGNWYYENQRHTLYDYEEYFSGVSAEELLSDNSVIDQQQQTLQDAGAVIDKSVTVGGVMFETS